MKNIFLNKKIIIFLVSVVVGIILVPTGLSITSEIKNTISEIQKNNMKPAQEHNEPWHKTMGWNISDIPKIFSNYKFEKIKDSDDIVRGTKSVKDDVTILATGNTDVEKLTLSFTDIKSTEVSKIIHCIVSYFFEGERDVERKILNNLNKSDKLITEQDRDIIIFDNTTTKTKDIIIKRHK